MELTKKRLVWFLRTAAVLVVFILLLGGHSGGLKNLFWRSPVPSIVVITKDSPFFNQVFEGIMAYHSQDPRCRLSTHELSGTADKIVMQQLVESALNDDPDLVIPIGVTISQLCVNAVARRKKKMSVVFVGPGTPVEQGIVTALEKRPEPVTGVSLASIDPCEPGRQLLRYKPSARSILIPFCPHAGAGVVEKTAVETAKYLEVHGCRVKLLPWYDLSEVHEKIKSSMAQVDTILCLESCWIAEANAVLVKLCNQGQVTLFAGDAQSVLVDGAVLGYGAFVQGLGAEAMKMAYQILLNGVYPGDIAVQAVDELRRPIINVEAAQWQGLPLTDEILRLVEEQERSEQWIGHRLSRS